MVIDRIIWKDQAFSYWMTCFSCQVKWRKNRQVRVRVTVLIDRTLIWFFKTHTFYTYQDLDFYVPQPTHFHALSWPRSLFKKGGGGKIARKATQTCWILSGNFCIHRKSGGPWPPCSAVPDYLGSHLYKNFTYFYHTWHVCINLADCGQNTRPLQYHISLYCFYVSTANYDMFLYIRDGCCINFIDMTLVWFSLPISKLNNYGTYSSIKTKFCSQ
jgi:hypothetical protein